jgi:hypothetical protein
MVLISTYNNHYNDFRNLETMFVALKKEKDESEKAEHDKAQ